MSLTGSQVIDKIRALAEERPNFVYPKQYNHPESKGVENATCFYVHHTEEGMTPGCIVGAALAALGVSLDDLSQHENTPGENVVRAFTGSGSTSAAEGDYIQHVQSRQDGGYSWAAAVADAERYTEDHYGSEWEVR